MNLEEVTSDLSVLTEQAKAWAAKITGSNAGDWEADIETEGGQENGLGQPEHNNTREWFTESRESHHRYVVTLIGPWMPGARPEVIERLRNEAQLKALLEEKNRADREESILRQAEEIMARRKEQP